MNQIAKLVAVTAFASALLMGCGVAPDGASAEAQGAGEDAVVAYDPLFDINVRTAVTHVTSEQFITSSGLCPSDAGPFGPPWPQKTCTNSAIPHTRTIDPPRTTSADHGGGYVRIMVRAPLDYRAYSQSVPGSSVWDVQTGACKASAGTVTATFGGVPMTVLDTRSVGFGGRTADGAFYEAGSYTLVMFELLNPPATGTIEVASHRSWSCTGTTLHDILGAPQVDKLVIK